jgi:hypothetical protein
VSYTCAYAECVAGVCVLARLWVPAVSFFCVLAFLKIAFLKILKMKRSIENDLEVVLADGSTWVESVVLRLASSTFKAMLSTEMKESREWKICLPDKAKYTFQTFYNLLLPATAHKIDKWNVEFVVAFAKEYCVDTLLEKGDSFLVEQVQQFEINDAHMVGDKFAFAKQYELKRLIAATLDYVIVFKTPGALFLHLAAFNAMEDCDLVYKKPDLRECFTMSQVLHHLITFSPGVIGGSYMPHMCGFPDPSQWFTTLSDTVGFYRHHFCRGPLRKKEFASRALMCYIHLFCYTKGRSLGIDDAYVQDLGTIYKDWEASNDDDYLHYKDVDDKVDLLEGCHDTRPNRPASE